MSALDDLVYAAVRQEEIELVSKSYSEFSGIILSEARKIIYNLHHLFHTKKEKNINTTNCINPKGA
jgi:hypothetical protein